MPIERPARPASDDYEGAPPPDWSLGAWLLEQANHLRSAIAALTRDAAVDREEVENLKRLANQLLAEVERSAKVQAAHGQELERVRRVAEEAQRQLNGLKISRGMRKAQAQKLRQGVQHRLN